jgi:hypothetical protein
MKTCLQNGIDEIDTLNFLAMIDGEFDCKVVESKSISQSVHITLPLSRVSLFVMPDATYHFLQ